MRARHYGEGSSVVALSYGVWTNGLKEWTLSRDIQDQPKVTELESFMSSDVNIVYGVPLQPGEVRGHAVCGVLVSA